MAVYRYALHVVDGDGQDLPGRPRRFVASRSEEEGKARNRSGFESQIPRGPTRLPKKKTKANKKAYL